MKRMNTFMQQQLSSQVGTEIYNDEMCVVEVNSFEEKLKNQKFSLIAVKHLRIGSTEKVKRRWRKKGKTCYNWLQ